LSDPTAPEPAQSPPEEPRRWGWRSRVILVLLAIFVCFAGLVPAGRAWKRQRAEREYAQAVADLERTEPNWDWERLNAARKRPPAGQNAAELIPQIKKRVHADWGKELREAKWQPLLEVPPNVRYSPAVLAEVRRDLTASTEAVGLSRSLKDFPQPGHREIHLKPDVLSTLLEDTQHTRLVAELLRWDIVVALEDGDFTRAAHDLQAMLNASRSIGDEPFTISQLVRMAVRSVVVRDTERLLANASNAPLLPKLQSALAADAEEPLLLYGLLGDRAGNDVFFASLDNGTLNREKILGKDDVREHWKWWEYRVHLPADRATYLTEMTRRVECARLPVHEQPAAFAALPAPARNPNHQFSGVLMAASDTVRHASWRTAAEARCAVVGIACERFRQKNGRWPNDLAELVPAYLPAIPLDPFDAHPLRFVKLDDGIVVHSVGALHSGGAAHSVRARPELPTGVEIGFRLWNPDQRRLPPLPDPVPPKDEPEP
jgi:hypothetical protein